MPKVTIVACTTEPEKIPEPILSRFMLRPVLEAYTEEEGAKIAKVMARTVLVGLPEPSPGNFRTISSAANANPRAIRRLLTTLRDLAIVGGLVPTARGGYSMGDVLAMHDVTEDGLDRTARRYLDLLVNEFGGKAGARAIASRLGVSPADAELLLMDRGFLIRTTTGREITPLGVRRTVALAVAAVK